MRSVTLVDDEPCALDVLVRAAQAWHYDCQPATSAEEAVEVLSRNPTPVVVTDLRMPGMGGAWLVREILRRWRETSIIVVTAGNDSSAVAECLDAGVHHFFLKPIHLDEFRHALEATFRTHQSKHERDIHRRHLQQQVLRQTRRLRRTYLSAIDSLVRTLEARDPYTSGHSFRVRRYALRLARAVGIEANLRKRISLAAKLHDIGKVGLPEGILNKPDVLTDAEYSIVREHPVIGERILAPVIRSRTVLATIRGHHERFDGMGYPDGLKGDEIPLAARVLAIADCFDALTSSRAYRGAWPRLAALEFLLAGAGRQFDPALVPFFIDMIGAERTASAG